MDVEHVAFAAATGMLEGIWHRAGARAAVVAPPHPQMGGRMDNPVVGALVEGLRGGAVSSLRFNWRGVGASDGAPSGALADAVEDYAAALDALEARTAPPFVACGYSFGALAALRVAVGDARIERVIAVAPPTRALPPELGELACPVTLIAGSDDGFVDVAALQRAADQGSGRNLHVLDGADHFFTSGLDELKRITAAAL